MIRFSANLGFLWTDRPLLDRIAAAGLAGFEAIELHWPYDVPAGQVAMASRRAGVKLLGMNTVAGDVSRGDFGLAAVPERQPEFEVGIRHAVEYCVASGGTMIHVLAGLVSDNPANTATFITNLKRASALAEPQGIQLLIEPMNRFDRPGYLLTRIEQAAEIIDAAGSSNIKVLFDFYHVARQQGDTLRLFEAALPQIGHVQIAAVPSRTEPDEGQLDYGVVLRTIDALGYAGWVGCEYRPRGGTDAGLTWIKRFDHKPVNT